MTLLALALLLIVTIPTLGVEAQTEALSVVGGQLSSPVNPDRIGTYQLQGQHLLLVGHVDWQGRARAFYWLRNLEEGAPIVVDGRSYHVSWIARMSPDDTEAWQEVTQPEDDVLTLVTCIGAFSQSRGEYLERLVVRASRD